MARRRQGYGTEYDKARKRMLATAPVCVHCRAAPATRADHQPPLSQHRHVRGSGCCVLVPSCLNCEKAQAEMLGGGLLGGMPYIELHERPQVETFVEPDGFPADHPVWDVAWLEGLREPPDGAAWPRLMTAPHPQAVDSLGGEAAAWSLDRRGRPWRWWQQLASTRLLEVDQDRNLVWMTMLLTLARQVGKTWWLRDICDWRLEHSDRFGGEQLVLSTGKDLAVVREMQRPARVRAKSMSERYKVREVNGQEEIELLADSSRWMIRSKEGVYGLTASMATVDEAWKVSAAAVDDGLVPTMVEQPQSQLILVSTAHRRATALMIGRRVSALEQLADPTDDLLLIEWSAARTAPLDDREAWRQASPHWSARREKLIAARLVAAEAGESDDIDEPNPVESFRAQWLNQWPARRVAIPKGEPLLEVDLWERCYRQPVDPDPGEMWVAVEDNFGSGAAIGAVALLDKDRVEVDGWCHATPADAFVEVARLVDLHPHRVHILVGPSMPDDVGTRVGAAETRFGLPLLRTMAAEGRVVHDDPQELADQLLKARVRKAANGGLTLDHDTRADIVRAVCWALRAATVRRPEPSVH